MISISVSQMTEAVHGTCYGCAEGVISSISTDSRSIAEGQWFIPIVGERFDGHDYIEKAMEQGAAGCFCQRLPEQIRKDRAYILVDDTKRALGDLAAWYRGLFDIPMVQITGSVGKTTTKEVIAGVLSQKLNTHKTPGNLNGDIGGPLTVLSLDTENEVGVIETGMDSFGQIRRLGEMIRPTIAVIANIGDAHTEFLGSRQGILKAKCEIFENLQPGGLAVLNGDDPLLNTLELPFETLLCGRGENCNVRITDVEDLGVEGVRCVVTTPIGRSYRLSVPAPGVHMIYAAAMAAAIGERLGLSVSEIQAGVAGYIPTGDRMRVEQLPGGRTMLNDSYNANPQSMEAALRVLHATDCTRRIAMLGDMKELGSATESGHASIGTLVGELGIDMLIAVGDYCRDYMVPAARNAGCPDVRWYKAKEDAYSDLVSSFDEGAALLLKASHFSGRFDLVADYLRDYPFEK